MPIEWCRDQPDLRSFYDVGLFPWSTAIFIRGARLLSHCECRGLVSIIKVVYDCFQHCIYFWSVASRLMNPDVMLYSSFLMKAAYDAWFAMMNIGRQCRHWINKYIQESTTNAKGTIQYSTRNLEELQRIHVHEWAQSSFPTQSCITMICSTRQWNMKHVIGQIWEAWCGCATSCGLGSFWSWFGVSLSVLWVFAV